MYLDWFFVDTPLFRGQMCCFNTLDKTNTILMVQEFKHDQPNVGFEFDCYVHTLPGVTFGGHY